MFSKDHLVAWLTMVLCTVAAGCGQGDRPKVVPVRGKVLLDGKPVEGAQVTFHPTAAAPRNAGGTTNANGEFTLTTFDTGDGAIPGEYIVTIYKPQASGNDDENLDPSADVGEAYDLAMESAESEDAEYEGVLPEKYASKETSPLKRTVAETGPNEFTFELEEGEEQ